MGGEPGEPGPPAPRRRALQRGFGVSQRWACQLVGQHRCAQRHQPTEPDRDQALREQLRRFSRAHPGWGYRRAHAQLVQQGWPVNRKAIQRRWREEGLPVPARRRNANDSAAPPARPTGWRPSTPTTCGRWTTSSTRPPTQGPFKLLNIVDEHTRQALTIQVDADRRRRHRRGLGPPGRRAWHRAAMHPLRQRAGADRQRPPRLVPLHRRRDQLHRAWLTLAEPYVESFGGRLRDELLAVEAFNTLLEAQLLVQDWRIEDNTVRPTAPWAT